MLADGNCLSNDARCSRRPYRSFAGGGIFQQFETSGPVHLTLSVEGAAWLGRSPDFRVLRRQRLTRLLIFAVQAKSICCHVLRVARHGVHIDAAIEDVPRSAMQRFSRGIVPLARPRRGHGPVGAHEIPGYKTPECAHVRRRTTGWVQGIGARGRPRAMSDLEGVRFNTAVVGDTRDRHARPL